MACACRTWLADKAACPYELTGVGYEVVQRAAASTTVLENIEGEVAVEEDLTIAEQKENLSREEDA